jgi:capsular polysaccharide biosynthesis protein
MGRRLDWSGAGGETGGMTSDPAAADRICAASLARPHTEDDGPALAAPPAPPVARVTPDRVRRLAEAAAASASAEAARKAATLAIETDLPAKLRADVARQVAAAGEPLLAWLLLTADPVAVRDAGRDAAAALLAIARATTDRALRAAAEAARRRLLGLSATAGQRVPPAAAQRAAPHAPPPRAFPLRILLSPGAPPEAEAMVRGLEDEFERALAAGSGPGVRLYRDVFVNANGQVWTRGGEQVVNGLRLGVPRPLAPEEALRLEGEAPQIEAAEFAARPADGNFFHWMVNRLPALRRYDRAGDPLPLLVATDCPRFVGESLAVAALPLRLARPASAVFVRQLYFSVQDVAALAAPGVEELHARLAAAADAVSSGAAAAPLVYLSRRDSGRRPLANEAELEDALRALGFTVAVFSGVPLLEQIRIIRAARLVVAPHGAGLAHLLFARPGLSVLELMPLVSKPRARVTMAQISRLRGHRHCLWLAPVTPGTERWQADLSALLPEIARLREEALAAA